MASVRVEGTCLHSGSRAVVHLHAREGPISFAVPGGTVEASVANVAATDRAVTLASGGASVSLVEHLLAALRVAGFHSGVLVECTGPEIPILDGSAQPWYDAAIGLGEPPAPPPPLRLAVPVAVAVGGSTATAAPGTEGLDVAIAFPHAAIGDQRWQGGPERYPELLGARTFGMLAEAQALRARGLVRGASLDHAIVFGDDGPLRPLRSADEPVRHKALDAIGDLALLGRPLDAHVSVFRGSHALHVALVSALLAQDDPTTEPAAGRRA